MDRDPEAPQGPFPDTIKQGDVFWIEADPSRGSIPGSPHPHVVVQDDLFNRSRISTVVVCVDLQSEPRCGARQCPAGAW